SRSTKVPESTRGCAQRPFGGPVPRWVASGGFERSHPRPPPRQPSVRKTSARHDTAPHMSDPARIDPLPGSQLVFASLGAEEGKNERHCFRWTSAHSQNASRPWTAVIRPSIERSLRRRCTSTLTASGYRGRREACGGRSVHRLPQSACAKKGRRN